MLHADAQLTNYLRNVWEYDDAAKELGDPAFLYVVDETALKYCVT
jgi:hypothetical protein